MKFKKNRFNSVLYMMKAFLSESVMRTSAGGKTVTAFACVAAPLVCGGRVSVYVSDTRCCSQK